MPISVEPVTRFTDARGALIKAWPGPVSGEVYVVELLPGHPRGHHYHERGGEWFVPLSGAATLTVADPRTGAQEQVTLSVGERARVEPFQAHVLSASGGPALVAAIADFEHADEVTVPYRVKLP